MRDIAQFSEADIVDTWASEPPACAEVHAMVFNMERGVHIDEAIEFLKDNPSLQPFDLILANELDFGAARSGEKNTAEEVAKALGLSYVFGLVFKLGVVGVWLAMICDWFVRSAFFAVRFRGNRWTRRQLIEG